MASNEHSEAFSPVVEEFLLSLTQAEQDVIAGCVQYLREHPEPDGVRIFDVPIYVPIMFRSMKCSGFVITFRMQDRKAHIYALVRDNGG